MAKRRAQSLLARLKWEFSVPLNLFLFKPSIQVKLDSNATVKHLYTQHMQLTKQLQKI